MTHDVRSQREQTATTLFSKQQPLVLGHRGAAADAPMNTLAAFQMAMQAGADGIELDTQLSQDGVPVVIHDDTLDATTNGKGPVAKYTHAELQTLDAGSWFGDAFAGERIPTLATVFEQMPARAVINVEIKHNNQDVATIVAAVAEVIRAYQRQQSVIVSSFNPYVLHAFRKKLPAVLLGWIHLPGLLPELETVLGEADYELYHGYFEAISARIVPPSARNKRIIAWTVNDANQARAMQRKGVRGIITDTPASVITALNSEH